MLLLAASSDPLLFGGLFGAPASEPRLAGTARTGSSKVVSGRLGSVIENSFAEQSISNIGRAEPIHERGLIVFDILISHRKSYGLRF